MNCKNCNTEAHHNFCPHCGQPTKLPRIDGHYIKHEIEHLLHFEHGLFFTIKELLTKPEQNIRNYLSENRSRLVKPIIFIIVTSLLYALSNSVFHFEDSYINYTGDKESATTALFIWIQGHYGYANIMMGIFIALWTQLFFRKYMFNVFEILILLCFVMGIGMLIFSVFGIAQSLTHTNLMQIAGIAGFVYTSWAIANFFDKSKFLNYVKAFLAYMLGMLSFVLSVIMLGKLIDTVLH